MGVMLRYRVDNKKLKRSIEEKGYAHMADFVRAHGFNRATLHHYMKGQGPFSESYYAICDALRVDPLALLSPTTERTIENADEILPIAQALCAAGEGIAVGLLGSRARGKSRKYSDWDLGVTRGVRPVSGLEFLRLKRTVDDAVDELPREVDIINLDAAPVWFLRGIDYEPIFLAGDSNAWAYFLGGLHGARRGNKGGTGAS